jgi:hypothetical protein
MSRHYLCMPLQEKKYGVPVPAPTPILGWRLLCKNNIRSLMRLRFGSSNENDAAPSVRLHNNGYKNSDINSNQSRCIGIALLFEAASKRFGYKDFCKPKGIFQLISIEKKV